MHLSLCVLARVECGHMAHGLVDDVDRSGLIYAVHDEINVYVHIIS
jgi:hypothetical protein